MNKLNHVAFIMDGNGRWGKKKNKGRNFGHINGVKTVKKIVETSVKLKIPIVTFYVFSTENWKRPRAEIKGKIAGREKCEQDRPLCSGAVQSGAKKKRVGHEPSVFNSRQCRVTGAAPRAPPTRPAWA